MVQRRSSRNKYFSLRQMSKSIGYRALMAEVARLRESFLPKPFDPLGRYRQAPLVHARTRAFVVLFHAEIESFLEEWAKGIARASETAWDRRAKVTTPSAFLLAIDSDPQSVTGAFAGVAKADLSKRFGENLKAAFQRFYRLVKENNGIKETNVLSMFCRLGISPLLFDAKLLADLSSLGVTRGEHAHHSARAVRNVLDPETEYNKAIELAKDLATVDDLLRKYRNQAGR
jgi:hypothetical protein